MPPGPGPGSSCARRRRCRSSKSLRLVKGSHIVVRKLFEHDHAYIFQNPDKRIIFAIPYEGEFTLIGTTDVEIQGDPAAARIDAAEAAYLCEQASRYFTRTVTPADIVWSYSGVRPLLDDESSDASAVTRDYLLDLDTSAAALLSVWGGKITTFRKLAEEAADLVCGAAGPLKPQPGQTWQGAWTEGAMLPGGDLSAWIGPAEHPVRDFDRFVAELRRRHPYLDAALAHRLARCYGMRLTMLLPPEGVGARGLGAEVAPGLYEAELHYLRRHEYARRADDVLWRRTKLGLHFTPEQRAAVERWWQAQPVPAPAAPSLEPAWS